MLQRLPPLRAIEAFVLVAETSSFSKAAQELNITKSAISRRIQSLEDDLGVKLFRRSNKALDLTNDGVSYFKITGPAFDALRTAGAQGSARPGPGEPRRALLQNPRPGVRCAEDGGAPGKRGPPAQPPAGGVAA